MQMVDSDGGFYERFTLYKVREFKRNIDTGDKDV